MNNGGYLFGGPPQHEPYLTPGEPQPQPGQAPYTAHRADCTPNYERDPNGQIHTKAFAGSEPEQFRAGDLDDGLALRQPL